MKKFAVLILSFFTVICFSYEKEIDNNGNMYQITKTFINENPALEITIINPDGPKSIIKIPGTEDPFIEDFPNIMYSENLSELFILYSKEREDGSDVYLQVMDKNLNFSSPYKVSESIPFTYCLNPKIHQTYKFFMKNGVKTIHQILHIIWWQKGALEGAVYASIPVYFSKIDFEDKVILYLDNFIEVEEKNIEGEVSDFLFENPQIFIPKTNENMITIIFANKKALSYFLLDIKYSLEEDTLRDRAHFPDIGVKKIIEMPVNFSVSSYPEFLFGAEDLIGLIVKETEFKFAYYCNGWSELNKIPGIENFYEAKEFVKRIIEEPIN